MQIKLIKIEIPQEAQPAWETPYHFETGVCQKHSGVQRVYVNRHKQTDVSVIQYNNDSIMDEGDVENIGEQLCLQKTFIIYTIYIQQLPSQCFRLMF